MTHQAFFITGTDTGVGKTTITGAITRALQQQGKSVGVLKPIETGVDATQRECSDTDRLRHLLTPPPSFDSVCLYTFPQPLAPFAAAQIAGTTIDLTRIHSHINQLTRQHSVLLIEGAGGIHTPLTPRQSMRDLVKLLDIPCLIVGSTNLGGVNHCRLTVEALEQEGICPCGIVLNNSKATNQSTITQQQQESTAKLIKDWASVPIFGPIDHVKIIETKWQEGVTQLAEHQEIQRLATHLSEMGTEIE